MEVLTMNSTEKAKGSMPKTEVPTPSAFSLQPSAFPYIWLELGVVYHPSRSLEAGIQAQTLLDDRYPEFHEFTTPVRGETPRTAPVEITWRF